MGKLKAIFQKDKQYFQDIGGKVTDLKERLTSIVSDFCPDNNM